MNAMMACFGKVARPVEAHVLDEMGQPALVVVFEDRPGLDGETKFGAPLGLPVGAHVVAEAVRQHAGGDERIDWNRLGERGGLWRGCRGRLLRGEGGHRRADKRDDAERAGVHSKTHTPFSPVWGRECRRSHSWLFPPDPIRGNALNSDKNPRSVFCVKLHAILKVMPNRLLRLLSPLPPAVHDTCAHLVMRCSWRLWRPRAVATAPWRAHRRPA